MKHSFLALLLSLASLQCFAGKFSSSATDDILVRLQAGSLSETSEVLELGLRSDPRILPALLKVAARYESQSRLRLRKIDGGRSEKANDSDFREIEIPIEESARKAAARLGSKKYFDYLASGLSSSDDEYRLECIGALAYVGDRAAIKVLMPIVDDDRIPVAKGDRILYRPAPFSGSAMNVIAKLIPADQVPEALKGFYSPETWKPAIKQWWKNNRAHFSRLEYGKEKSFEVSSEP